MYSRIGIRGILALLMVVGGPVWALPFNQDMVGTQYGAGSLMRPEPEGSVAVGESERAVDGDPKSLVNPIPSSPESVGAGGRLFSTNCSPCHGRYFGDVHVPGAVSSKLMVPAPNLATEGYKSRTDGEIFYTISNGIRSMPQYGWKLSLDERWHLVNFVRAVQSAGQKGSN